MLSPDTLTNSHIYTHTHTRHHTAQYLVRYHTLGNNIYMKTCTLKWNVTHLSYIHTTTFSFEDASTLLQIRPLTYAGHFKACQNGQGFKLEPKHLDVDRDCFTLKTLFD